MGRFPGIRGWVKEILVTDGTYERDGSRKSDSVKTHYFFDSYGNIVSQERTVFDAYGASSDTIAYRYDHRGRLHSTILFHNGDTLHLTRFHYNDTTDHVMKIVGEGMVSFAYSPEGVCHTCFSSKGQPEEQLCYRDGRLVSRITYNSYWGTPEELLTVMEYDGAGRPLLLGDVRQPDDKRSQWSLEYDPYGNILSSIEEYDTVVVDYQLYDSHRNWLVKEVTDNGWHNEWCRRQIVYASDSADFADVYRQHNPFWSENHQSGYFEVYYPGGDYYLGNLVEGRRQGHGEMIFTSGERYEGDFYDNRFHGAGILHRIDDTIIGTWHHGAIEYNHVEIRYANGNVYSGEYHPANDSCRYRGETHLADGGIYQGEYALERYDGYGKLKQGDGTHIEGYWKNGKPDGTVLIIMPNLDRHYATFSHGLRVAKCVILYIDGSQYEGETNSSGIPNGYGTMTYPASRERTGYFVDGKYVGKHRPRASR